LQKEWLSTKMVGLSKSKRPRKLLMAEVRATNLVAMLTNGLAMGLEELVRKKRRFLIKLYIKTQRITSLRQLGSIRQETLVSKERLQ